MPLPRVQTSVTLFGSPPWGFRISGGKEFNQPLVITRVTPGSLAARSGVQSGDVVVAINNQFVSNLSQDECEAKVRQAVGSLHLVLEKNAAKVTELPGGQVTVEGDRSIYTATKDAQQRISKYNRSAKPFGAPDSEPAQTEEKAAESKPSGYRPISFRPKAPSSTPNPSNDNSLQDRGVPDGVSSTTESMSNVKLQDTAKAESPKFNVSSYNRKPKPFSFGNSNNSNNEQLEEDPDLPPPPPDFITESDPPVKDSSQFVTEVNVVIPGLNPSAITSAAKKKMLIGPNAALGLYSKQNAEETYQAQVGDL